MADLPKELIVKRRERRKGALAQDITETAQYLAAKAETGEFTDGSYVATIRHLTELIAEYQGAFLKPAPATGDGIEPMSDAEPVPVVDTQWTIGIASREV